MKDFSATDTLLTALPILLVLLALVGAIVFFPEGSVLDIRGRAAPFQPSPTIVAVPTRSEAKIPRIPAGPETICSDLYQPICSQVDRKTYANDCEAGLANALPATPGECNGTLSPTAAPAVLPSY